MWHKPCRTFHPWCPCIKTRCLVIETWQPGWHGWLLMWDAGWLGKFFLAFFGLEFCVSSGLAYVITSHGNLWLQVWNEDLAHGARLLAGSCVYGHGYTTWPGSPFGSVGQNLFTDSTAFSVSWPLRTWWYEKWNYDYGSGSCSFICGHYTQVSHYYCHFDDTFVTDYTESCHFDIFDRGCFQLRCDSIRLRGKLHLEHL